MSKTVVFSQEEALHYLRNEFPESNAVSSWLAHPPKSEIRQVAKLRSGPLLDSTWAEAQSFLLERLIRLKEQEDNEALIQGELKNQVSPSRSKAPRF